MTQGRFEPLRRVAHTLSRLAGFGSSMVLLALASLLILPQMIKTEGASAWGSIAFGQAIGGVAAVIVAYGWYLSGPAVIAQASPPERRREFTESLLLKSCLLVPVAGACVLLSWLFAPQRPDLAALGALSSATVGLSASWYFVGLAQPYGLLLAETVPRVLGTVVGIVLMRSGFGADTGLLCQWAGMISATVVSAVVIVTGTLDGPSLPRRGLRQTARRQALGMSASVLGSAYVSAPIVLVSFFSPAIQPVYALVDKLQRQIAVGLTPMVHIAQGWVPLGELDDRPRRIRRTLLLLGGVSAGLAVVVAVLGSLLVRWVGGGVITVSPAVNVLMGVFIGIVLFELIVAHAVLPVLERLDVVTKATLVGACVALPLCVLGSFVSIELALVGFLTGLGAQLTIELTAALAATRAAPGAAVEESAAVQVDGGPAGDRSNAAG